MRENSEREREGEEAVMIETWREREGESRGGGRQKRKRGESKVGRQAGWQ